MRSIAQGWGRKFHYKQVWNTTTDGKAIVFPFGVVQCVPIKSSSVSLPEEITTVELIHKQVMEMSNGKPALNGCECPHCDSQRTYDVRYENNYYFGCVDCERAVAIWVETELQEIACEPWIVLP